MCQTINQLGFLFLVKFCTGKYNSVKPTQYEYELILRSSLTGAQFERVTDRIREIRPETIVFVAVMRQLDILPPSALLVN